MPPALPAAFTAILNLSMQTKIDISYGVIPIHRANSSWEVFLIHQFSMIGNNSYWVFPKGHPEKGETPKQSAIRELKEETGLVPDKLLDNPIFSLKYSFVVDGVQVQKRVDFFIGIIKDTNYQLDSVEVKEAGWYSLQDVSDRLDYQDTKKMFEEVHKFIESYSEEAE
jgi:8-oxo-dGTP pyrophosphatase MutT (NUDIX family)